MSCLASPLFDLETAGERCFRSAVPETWNSLATTFRAGALASSDETKRKILYSNTVLFIQFSVVLWTVVRIEIKTKAANLSSHREGNSQNSF